VAIYEAQTRVKPGTKSNTKLHVSGGMSPAEQWFTDPSLPVLFNYDYGGPAQKEVVISKGMAVGILPDPILDYESGQKRGALSIAGVNGAVLVGLAPYNFTKHNNDFLDGNQPSIITREYIELPYLPNAADAAAVKWGAVHGAGLKNGDLVTHSRDAQNLGKLIKWIEGTHLVSEILGQVLAMDINQEPFGWLKWALWDETAKNSDQGPLDKAGYSYPGEAGYPYDGNYNAGTIEKDGYQSIYTTNPTGIPGILDGSQKAQTPQTKSFTVPQNTVAGTKFVVDLGLKNIVEGTVAVFRNAAADTAVWSLNYATGILTYTALGGNTTQADTVAVNFRANFFGTPAGWDYKGAAGAVRILLKR
jgi:hypothetical protein